MTTPENKDKAATTVAITTQSMVPAFMDLAQFHGAGFEGTDQDSFALPFLQVLQKGSPMCDEDDAAYVEGAKAGMLYNTVTQEMIDGKTGIEIIPCCFKRSYIQWGGRESDEGGFKGEFSPVEIDAMVARGEVVEHEGKLYKANAEGKVKEKKDDYFADTRSHYILIKAADGTVSQAILSLASTQIKASKMLMMALSQRKMDTPAGKLTPPTFANIVKMTTQGQSNSKGSWSGVKFEITGLVTDEYTYKEALAFHNSFVSGEVKADYSKAPVDGGSSGGEPDQGDAEKF